MSEPDKCPKCGANPTIGSESMWVCGSFAYTLTGGFFENTTCLRNQLTKLQSENERRKQFFKGARIETESILGHFYMYYRWKIVLPVGVEIGINHYGWKSAEEAEEAARQFMGGKRKGNEN